MCGVRAGGTEEGCVTIKVAIADDHSLVRQGLRRYLDMADGIEVVGEASNGKELLELIGNENPDIALIDIRMPEMDGLEAARVIRDQHPKVGVIMLTAYDDRQFVVEAVRSGARTAARVMEPGMAFGHHEGSWTRRSPVGDRLAWRPFSSQRSRSSRLSRRWRLDRAPTRKHWPGRPGPGSPRPSRGP